MPPLKPAVDGLPELQEVSGPNLRSLLDDKRWVLKAATQPGDVTGACGVAAQLLFLRASGSRERFLQPTPFHSPSLLSGVKDAVERLVQALQRQEQVFIHGDFDVDGITGTALFYLGLRQLGFSKIKVDVSDRQRGHGPADQVVQRLIAEKFSLLVTVDCGISDVEAVTALRAAGIDTLVTDHHQPPTDLPPAVALINPKLPGCRYPNPDLAGVGVAFQLLRALYERLDCPLEQAHFLDLVMLGTVADLVPLVRNGERENHELVRSGLEQVAQGNGNVGLQTLMKTLGLNPAQPSAGQIGFIVAPHLNAANRVGDPRVALLLLTTRNQGLAQYLAETLIAYNQDRKLAQTQLCHVVDQQLEGAQRPLAQQGVVWLEGTRWNPGILGLVASHVADEHGLPVFLVSREGAISRASARSVGDFNLIRCLQHCGQTFLRYGGHAMAAGFTIRTAHLPLAKEQILAYARDHARQGNGVVHEIDLTLAPEQVGLTLHEEIQQLAPFGVGHPTPRFLLPRVSLSNLVTVGEGKHLKCLARANGCTFEAIGFDMGSHLSCLMDAQEVGLVFRVGRNDWLGQTKVQLELADVVEPTDA